MVCPCACSGLQIHRLRTFACRNGMFRITIVGYLATTGFTTADQQKRGRLSYHKGQMGFVEWHIDICTARHFNHGRQAVGTLRVGIVLKNEPPLKPALTRRRDPPQSLSRTGSEIVKEGKVSSEVPSSMSHMKIACQPSPRCDSGRKMRALYSSAAWSRAVDI